jgi:hypothetical protein
VGWLGENPVLPVCHASFPPTSTLVTRHDSANNDICIFSQGYNDIVEAKLMGSMPNVVIC